MDFLRGARYECGRRRVDIGSENEKKEWEIFHRKPVGTEGWCKVGTLDSRSKMKCPGRTTRSKVKSKVAQPHKDVKMGAEEQKSRAEQYI